jgi:hypothetical protein
LEDILALLVIFAVVIFVFFGLTRVMSDNVKPSSTGPRAPGPGSRGRETHSDEPGDYSFSSMEPSSCDPTLNITGVPMIEGTMIDVTGHTYGDPDMF